MSSASTLGSWLKACDEHHTSCTGTRASLPPRILDISSNIPHLVEFLGQEAPKAIYATLSHCWGDCRVDKPTQTTRMTLESRKSGIPLDSLSPLFRDTIQLLRLVGCNYLWIDSLCIIQDDEIDWTIQSEKMGGIYSNAYLNIAATSSANSTQGLFHDRWTLVEVPDSSSRCPLFTYDLDAIIPNQPVSVRRSHYRDHEYIHGPLINGRWAQAPLLERAWVLQEILLARRTLYICASELFWECRSCLACECQPGYHDTSHSDPNQQHLKLKQEFSHIKRGQYSKQAIFDFWLRVSQRYSGLSLTKTTDRLVALDELASIARQSKIGTYVAGIWVDDLPRALLWFGTPRSD